MERQHKRQVSSGTRSAFTLVELLVVIAIIGVLVALLLPAVQAARESARRITCTNQVKQIMLSMINHEGARGAFPSGGIVPWPEVEDYQSGVGGAPYGPRKQGLGWTFQILPYMESGNVYNLKTTVEAEEVNANGFNCPSRRGATQTILQSETPGSDAYPYLIDYAAAVPLRSEAEFPATRPGTPSPRYQINSSINDTTACGYSDFWGVKSGGMAHAGSIKSVTDLGASYSGFWGVIVRSDLLQTGSTSLKTGFYTKISYAQLEDGSSNTLVVSEKSLVPSEYETGTWHDDKGYSGGWDPDSLRSSYCRLSADEEPSDTTSTRIGFRFGSAHPAILNAGFADGSVQQISYDIEMQMFNSLAHRNDGALIDASAL